MNALLLLASMTTVTHTWESPTPPGVVHVGAASRYDDQVMAHVLEVRGVISDTDLYFEWLAGNGYVGAVALERAGDLGRLVWIDGEGPFYVADCRQLAHYPGAFVVEVDARTARRWKRRGPWPEQVTVSFEPPRPVRMYLLE